MDITNKELSPADRTLRCVSVWTFIWTLSFGIPYTVRNRDPMPALCLIPMGISGIAGLYHLTTLRLPRFMNTLFDLGISAFLLIMLIATNVSISNSWRANTGYVMIGTLSTVPLMVNICIHAYFAFREMYILQVGSLLFGNMLKSPTCPHCQHEFFSHPGLSGSSSATSKPSYQPVQHQEYDEGEGEAEPSSSKDRKIDMVEYKDARDSTDDETARLV